MVATTLSFVSSSYPTGTNTGSYPAAVAAANLNGAGGIDLVVLDRDLNAAAILLGDGSGGFSSGGSLSGATGFAPTTLAVGSLGFTGNADILIGGGGVVYLWQNSAGSPGSFSNAGSATVGGSVNSIQLPVPGSNEFLVADGTMTVADITGLGGQGGAAYHNFTAGVGGVFNPNSITQLVAGDFGNDGMRDIVVTGTFNGTNGYFDTLPRNGVGNYGSNNATGSGTGGKILAVGDFNHNGGAVYIVALGTSLLYDGTTYVGDTAVTPTAMATGDFDGDGKLDFVAAYNSGGNGYLDFRMGNGSGGFTAITPLQLGTNLTGIAVADLNGDGKDDIAVTNATTGDNSLKLLISNVTGAPTITTIGPDTGFSGSDHITSAGTLTVTGSGQSGDVVTLKDGSSTIGTATVSGSSWTIGNVSLAAGTHSLSASSGNGTSSTVTLVVDQTAPTITSQVLTTGGGTTLASGATTASTSLILKGTTEANSHVVIYDGASSISGATAIADGGGNFSYTITGAAGSHAYGALPTDLAGNTASAVSTGISITIAPLPTAPVITSVIDSGSTSIPVGGVTNNDFTISGTAPPNATITLYDGNHTVPGGQTTADGSGNWSQYISHYYGAHAYSFTATDGSGNISSHSTAYLLSVALQTLTPGATVLPDGNGVLALNGASSASFDLSTVTLSGVARLTLPALNQVTLSAAQLSGLSGLTFGGATNRMVVNGAAGATIDLSSAGGIGNLGVLDLGNSSGTQNVIIGTTGPAKLVSNGQLSLAAAAANIQIFGGSQADSFTGSGASQTFVASLGAGNITANGANARIFLNDPDYAYSVSTAASGQQVGVTGSNALLVGRRATDSASHAVSLTGSDYVNLGGSSTADTILAAAGAMNIAINSTRGGHLILGGSGNLSVQDNSLAGNDTIYGGDGGVNLAYLANLGYGGSGSGDTVIAGNGALTVVTSSYVGSTIYAGIGTDIIAISKATTLPSSSVIDTVVGFQAGVDKLDLTALGIATADQFAAIQRTTYANGIGLKFSDNQEIRLIGTSSISLADVHLGAGSPP